MPSAAMKLTMLTELKFVRITEVHDHQRGTTIWIVDAVLRVEKGESYM